VKPTDTDLPPTGWRMLPLVEGEPQALLDEGLALLDGLADDPTPVLRWYRSTRTAVVLGRGQHAPAARAGLQVLTRFSGGGAVLMDPHLLSCDVAIPTGHPLLDGDLTAVFDRIGHAWATALTQLGVTDLEVHRGASTATRRGTAREQLLAAVCYATLGRGEVTAGGRKLVGLAQRRRRQGALVQCGLLRRWQPASLLEAFGADPGDVEIDRAAVGLDQLGHADLVDEVIIRAVSNAIAG
jgi:lipoate---protein ligase